MSIAQRIEKILAHIRQLESTCNRPNMSVTLLAVTKGQTPDAIKEAFDAGLSDFGENYYQDAQTKISALQHLPIHWHFIGPIQSNKTRGIAENFSWVHSVCRPIIAKRLNDARPQNRPPINVCLQVNMDQDANKSGISQLEIPNLIQAVLKEPNLRLRGLMMIPKQCDNALMQQNKFSQLTNLLLQFNQQFNIKMDTLSMGMSQDYPTAICAGSTIVRIGHALFGEQQ